MFVFKSNINSFHYLYQDAEYFHGVAHDPNAGFTAVRASRSAVLLYILSLEALINRALDHFAPQELREFFLAREERFSIEDKWQLLPLLAGKLGERHFDRSRYPWSHFAELIKLRNDFVHPKHDRAAYYEALTKSKWLPLAWNRIPDGMDIKESEIVYRLTRIPRDPYAIREEHADTVKSVVDAMIVELDRLLEGRILRDDWCRRDQMGLAWPVGAKLDDLPSE
ncbi:MAG: hypothetical protein LAO78_19205 [Acidobacteriia bacterium]|nr:hypothetical protein [Terriglobia bacterium]